MEPNDQELIRRFAAERDEAAFAEIVRRHGTMVQGVCRRILTDTGASDDAVQGTFVVLAGNARTLARRDGRGDSLAPWLYRVAFNTALQSKRQARTRRYHEAACAQIRQVAGASAETPDLLSVLDEELNALPSRFQAPLVLCHLKGKTQQQAAREVGLTYATVRRRLDVAKRQLQTRLARRGFAVSAGVAAALLSQSAASAAPLTPKVLATTVKSARIAWHLADAPISWAAVLGAKLATWGAKAASVGIMVKLKAAAVLVVIASGALAATHIADQWTADADELPMNVAVARPVVPAKVAVKRSASRRSTLKRADRGMSASSEAPARSAGDNQQSKTTSASTSSDSFQAELNDNGQVTQFDDPADKQKALELIREKMKRFPDLPANPLLDELLESDDEPPQQAPPAPLPDDNKAAERAKPAADQANPTLDDRAAKRKRASEERRNKTRRAAQPNRNKSKVRAGRSNTEEFCGITWHPSVEQALAAAQGVVSDERDKPVLCLRVLGDLAGFM